MTRYLVVTKATVTRHYEVLADNAKDAIEESSNMAPTFEEDENEETVSVSPTKD